LLVEYQLPTKIISYIKDESTNLNAHAIALTSIVSCAPLQLASPFSETCFGHVMFKACQYATNDNKVGVGMKEANLVYVQFKKQLHEQKSLARRGKNGSWLARRLA
jgi:hypothetical protein